MTPLLDRLAKAAIVLEVVLGLGAVGGGLALIVGPRGEVIRRLAVRDRVVSGWFAPATPR